MKRAALISIYEEHIRNILSGKKIFEYRKNIPKYDISHLVFYCTAPIQKIIAVAEVLECITASYTKIWNYTSIIGSGISRSVFRSYYEGKGSASAFILGEVYRMKPQVHLSDLFGCQAPPQSFSYLSENDMKLISERKSASPAAPESLIFMGGVHGAGKSALAEGLSEMTRYKYVNANDLISPRGEKAGRDKRVGNIKGNQDILLEEIAKMRKKHRRLLITGHFTLVNKKGEIEPIDIKVFDDMKPDKMILVTRDENKIRRCLKERDQKEWKVSLIREFQKREKEHAKYISKKLKIPLRAFQNDHDISSGLEKLINGD